MKITRKETWGDITYDTQTHTFDISVNRDIDEQPYVAKPVLLNIDLTFKCNMRCRHCVAKDMAQMLGGEETSDLKISSELIQKINQSPFMVMVLTGGEPLLEEYEESLLKLLRSFKSKGIIVDTNGTIIPSPKTVSLLKNKNVMVRVSWDSPNPNQEYILREYPKGFYKNHEEYIEKKQDFIRFLISHGITVGIQSVIHRRNFSDPNLLMMPYKFKELKIDRWYIQRYIPTGYNKDDDKYIIGIDEYEESTQKLIKKLKNLV